MKHLKIFLMLMLLALAVHADIYVSPEEHRAYAKQGLEEQLSTVPADQQVEYVKAQLAKIPQEREDLKKKVAEAEAAESSGKDRTGPPAYFLAKGFEGLDYKEEAMKNWLTEHKDSPPQPKASPSPQSNNPVATPTIAAQPAQTSGAVAMSSAQVVALVLLGAGLLLGARRALA